MKLIVNADDYGMTKGVNLGIIEAHKNGIVTSTTLMVTMPEVEHGLALSKDYPNLGIGLHLNCTLSKPLTDCKSLIKENGDFYKPRENPNQDLFDEEEIYQEFLAQYELFVKLVGRKPTHIDSHLYAHQVYPKAKAAALRLANEKGIAIREFQSEGYKQAIFYGDFKYKDGETMEQLMEKLVSDDAPILKSDVVELMCHPAYIDNDLFTLSTYTIGRIKELDILTSENVKSFVKKNNIELINFNGTRLTYVQD
jgi:predicted glycoside hydrolase/deacetylase ChbG (UPF0249 family)